MRPAYKYCLMSFLATLPITVPFALKAIYHEYDLDLYVELCFQRLLDGTRPLYCGFKPSYPPRAIVATIAMASVMSVLLMPAAFPIVYGIVKFRSWWIARRNDDAPPTGQVSPKT